MGPLILPDALAAGHAPPAATGGLLPPPAPLEMPVQSLRARPRPVRALPSWPPLIGLRRLVVVGGAALLTLVAAWEMARVLAPGAPGQGLLGLGLGRMGPPALVILVLFVLLFAWIALSLTSSLAGFACLLAQRPEPPPAAPGAGRVALLMPAYNEDPARIMAALAVTRAELDRLGAAARYDLFILSDTTDPDAWIAEEAAFLRLRGALGDATGLFYRRRPHNTERKAGNIADWVRRWGGGYELFMILDADSVLSGECILRLADALDRRPWAGLAQSLPCIVGARTLFARLQQFAGRVYGPMIAAGLAWWHGAESNYWGHNAMIRTRAFAEAAGLPALRGRRPVGGHILSHDFVEAALLRRAGWGVVMLPAIEGSYEECPPSLTELAARDRRWCQGNLQHLGVVGARGLHWVSRLHLLMGIGSYVTAPLWLLFLVVGILAAFGARFATPVYFPSGPALFPTWPVVDPVRSMWLFVGTMGVLLLPKVLAVVALCLRGARGFGGAVALVASLLVETVLAGLLAPVTMLTQTASVLSILAGRDGGWAPQLRQGVQVPFGRTLRAYLPHTLVGLALGLASWAVALPLLLWMSPVVLGLVLAAPLAHLTGREGPGAALRRIGLLVTAEERAPPPVLRALRGRLDAFAVPAMPAAARLLSDPGLLALHRALLPAPRRRGDPFDPALLLGLARVGELTEPGAFEALPRAERAAVLGCAEGLQALQRLGHPACAPEPGCRA